MLPLCYLYLTFIVLYITLGLYKANGATWTRYAHIFREISLNLENIKIFCWLKHRRLPSGAHPSRFFDSLFLFCRCRRLELAVQLTIKIHVSSDCIVNLIVYKHMHKIVNTNHTKNLTTNYIKINFLIRNNPNDFKYKY